MRRSLIAAYAHLALAHLFVDYTAGRLQSLLVRVADIETTRDETAWSASCVKNMYTSTRRALSRAPTSAEAHIQTPLLRQLILDKLQVEDTLR